MKQLLKIVAIAFLSIGSLEAKSYGSSSSSRSSSSSSSSRSSSSSSSYSRPTPTVSKPTPAPAAKPYAAPTPSSSASKPNTAKPQTSTRPTSNVDTARYKQAVKSGKVFTTRESAVNDFKATKASTYTSKYASEPSSRPEHIPSTYRGSDGNNYNITYNQQGGGYGYYSGGGPGLGTFIMYDMMSDALMMNAMMDRQQYYVGPPPVAQSTTYVTHRSSGWTFFWILFSVALIVGFVVFLTRSTNNTGPY